MGARSLVLIVILAAVCLAGFGVIDVDAQVVIWLLVAMAIAIVIASFSNRSGSKKDALPTALIPATPMADLDTADEPAELATVGASAPPATTAEAVASVIGGTGAVSTDDVELDDPEITETIDLEADDTETDDVEIAAEADDADDVADEPVTAEDASDDDTETDDDTGRGADVIDIQRGRRPSTATTEETPVTTTARPTSIPLPEIERDEAPVSPIRLPKPAARTETPAPSLKVDRAEKPEPATPQLHVTKSEPTPAPAPVISTRSPEPDTDTADADTTDTEVAAAPVTTSSTVVSRSTGTDLEPKVAAATRKAIADLVERGRLSNEGPITDADVKTIIFLAISAEEVVALVDGGYVTEDGQLTADKAKAKPFQASA